MKRAAVALLCGVLGALGCGDGNGDGEVLGPDDGGAFIIVEMPFEGTNNNITQLRVRLLNQAGQPFAADLIFSGDDFQLQSGTWPSATGSCNPFRTEDAGGFLPASSSCITFSLVRTFNDTDPDPFLVTMSIEAIEGTVVVGSIAKTVVLEPGVFKNDPALIPNLTFNDIDDFIATLNVVE